MFSVSIGSQRPTCNSYDISCQKVGEVLELLLGNKDGDTMIRARELRVSTLEARQMGLVSKGHVQHPRILLFIHFWLGAS